MNGSELLEKLELLDPALIEEAASVSQTPQPGPALQPTGRISRFPRRLRSLLTTAAVITLIVVPYWWYQNTAGIAPDKSSAPTMESIPEQSASTSGSAPVGRYFGGQKGEVSQSRPSTKGHTTEGASRSNTGSPSQATPETALTANQMTTVIYQGKNYKVLLADDTAKIEASSLYQLSGQYLGEAVNRLPAELSDTAVSDILGYDPYRQIESGQDGFSANISGQLYSLKGYDPALLLLLIRTDEIYILHASDYEGLKSGSDLFVDVLRMDNRLTDFYYEQDPSTIPHAGNRENLTAVDMSEAQKKAFLEALFAGQPNELSSGSAPFAYPRIRLWLPLPDGISLPLDVFQNGVILYGGELAITVDETVVAPLFKNTATP